jgi:hypothetical protein
MVKLFCEWGNKAKADNVLGKVNSLDIAHNLLGNTGRHSLLIVDWFYWIDLLPVLYLLRICLFWGILIWIVYLFVSVYSFHIVILLCIYLIYSIKFFLRFDAVVCYGFVDCVGLEAFASFLEENKSLRKVKIDNNNVTYNGWNAIYNALFFNFTLEKIKWYVILSFILYFSL